MVENSSLIYQSRCVNRSSSIFFCSNIDESSNMRLCDNMTGCSFCCACSGLSNQSYCINNTYVGKDNYHQLLQQYLSNNRWIDFYYQKVLKQTGNNIGDRIHGQFNKHCYDVSF